MSSRVLAPEDNPLAEPMVFRQVAPGPGECPPDTDGKLQPLHADGAGTLPAPDSPEQVAQLQRQTEQRVREAHAAGLKEGEAVGRNRAAAELQPVIERLARAIEEISGLRGRLRKEAEGDMVKLSLAIARRVLRRELALDPEAVHGLVLAALEKLQAHEICRVKVHPSLAAAVTTCLQKALSPAVVEVVADGTREPGTVIFETARGNLDASVESQFQEIERGLTDRLRGAS
jgi:flagellar assembly protein FliH